jgi:hypothetical protein
VLRLRLGPRPQRLRRSGPRRGPGDAPHGRPGRARRLDLSLDEHPATAGAGREGTPSQPSQRAPDAHHHPAGHPGDRDGCPVVPGRRARLALADDDACGAGLRREGGNSRTRSVLAAGARGGPMAPAHRLNPSLALPRRRASRGLSAARRRARSGTTAA